VLKIISKKLVNYEYSSVQFDMPKTLADSILSWGKKNIPNSDLFTEEKKYGRENEIHVTVKYGLHTADVRKIQKVVEDFGSFSIKLGAISRFVPKDKDYDVVKIEVDGDGLSALHQKIGELPNSDEHPVYRAHCTIAYVKKGCCSELSSNTELKDRTAKVTKLTFSSHTGEKSEIDLC
jgi:2'-5' RNA ligase